MAVCLFLFFFPFSLCLHQSSYVSLGSLSLHLFHPPFFISPPDSVNLFSYTQRWHTQEVMSYIKIYVTQLITLLTFYNTKSLPTRPCCKVEARCRLGEGKIHIISDFYRACRIFSCTTYELSNISNVYEAYI